MQLVEQHVIDRKDPRYGVIDEAAFKSKNLYNAALYEIRQAFIHEGSTSTTARWTSVCSPTKPTKHCPRRSVNKS